MSHSTNVPSSGNIKPKVSSLNLSSAFKPQNNNTNKPASGRLILH